MKKATCSQITECLPAENMPPAERQSRQREQMEKCDAHLPPGLHHPHCLLLRSEVSILVGKEK
jgi:hypothetical protein